MSKLIWTITLLALASLVIVACQPQVAKDGDTVQVDYTGKLENGSIFDTSIQVVAEDAGILTTGRAYKPLSVVLGSHSTIKGFENALVGMKVGEKKTVTIPPTDAYGFAVEDNVQTLPLTIFGDTIPTLTPGQTIGLVDTQGRTKPARVVSLTNTSLIVDLNHPLAGKTLVFDLEIREIQSVSKSASE